MQWIQSINQPFTRVLRTRGTREHTKNADQRLFNISNFYFTCVYMTRNWSWTLELSPPWSGAPEVSTVPSAKIAAIAAYVSQTCWTFLSWPWIRKLSLPKCRLPHFHLHLLLSQQKQRMCRESAEPYWTDLGLWGCRPHSLERPITSITPQSKRFACCCYLWLLCNSSNGVSILKLRKSKRVCWI